MSRSREILAASSVVAATTVGGLALNEYNMSSEASKITEANNRLDECIDYLTEECLKAAGVEIRLTYRDLSFDSGSVKVDSSYFIGELQNLKQPPIDPLDKRVTYGAGGMLAGLGIFKLGKTTVHTAKNFLRRRREEDIVPIESKALQNIS